MRIAFIISVFLNLILAVFLFMPENEQIGEEDYSETDQQPKEINIVMLGNSITHAGDWEDLLKRDDIFNGGMPGWTTEQLSWVIKNYVTPNKPKVCFFKGGINDYTLGITTDRIYRNITMILDSIRDVGTIPVYQTTLYKRTYDSLNREIDTLNSRMIAFCENRGYDFVDLREKLCANGDIKEEYVKDDLVHLKPEAYPVWAAMLKPVLMKYDLDK